MANLLSELPLERRKDILNRMAQQTDDENAQQKQGPESFGGYLELKKRKLFHQVHNEDIALKEINNIFKGLSFYVNGHTEPSASELRRLIVQNGGQYHHYYTSNETKYIIACQLASSKWKSLGPNSSSIVITPQWVVDCVKANRRLSIRNYLLVHAASGKPAVSRRKSGYQPSIDQFGNIRKRPFAHKDEKKLEKLEIDNECKLKEDKPNKEEIGLSIKSCNNEIHSEAKEEPIVIHRLNKGKLKLNYGQIDQMPNTIFLGTTQINYSRAATKPVIQQLVVMYKAKLKEFDLRSVQVSVNFLERVFSGDGGDIKCVHPDWPVVLDQLKDWLNQSMAKILNARLFTQKKEEKGPMAIPSN